LDKTIASIVTLSKGLLLASLLTLIALPSKAESEFQERFDFSGFGRIVGGYLDDDGASYEGYTNKVSFSTQSLFALQTDVKITDKIRLSAQLLGHTNDDRESGLEWLYFSYEPNRNWLFKAGKLRTPFFRYSDVADVGFSYPWITLPQQIYGGFLFSNYDGASATYRFSVKRFNFEIEGYYGVYEGEFDRAGIKTSFDVDEIKGLILSFNSGNLSARISTIQSSDFYADIPGFTELANAFKFAGFEENAEAFSFDGSANAYQMSINYDTLDYFVAAEWARTASDLIAVPQIEGYYLTAGYNFYPYQAHITYASSSSTSNAAPNAIPKGLNPQLDALSFTYDQIITNLPLYGLDSVTLGLRWDFRHNMSLKTEITFLNGEPEQNSFFSSIEDPDFDRDATLYQLSVEWIF
jgi:hypothetical protein